MSKETVCLNLSFGASLFSRSSAKGTVPYADPITLEDAEKTGIFGKQNKPAQKTNRPDKRHNVIKAIAQQHRKFYRVHLAKRPHFKRGGRSFPSPQGAQNKVYFYERYI